MSPVITGFRAGSAHLHRVVTDGAARCREQLFDIAELVVAPRTTAKPLPQSLPKVQDRHDPGRLTSLSAAHKVELHEASFE
jgi:hypothetical protein